MTMKSLKKSIDPLLAVSVFVMFIAVTTAIWNSMKSGVPLGEFLLVGQPVPPLFILIFLLALGTGRQIRKPKQKKH